MSTLADFGAELHLESGPVWRRYGGSDWLAPAVGITISKDAIDRPRLHLSLTRAALPDRPPDPFSMLDLTFSTGRDPEQALVDLREVHPAATVSIFMPNTSFLDLGDLLLSGQIDGSLDMASSGQCRMIRRLSWEGGVAIKEMLENGINPFIVSGAAEFVGISPRVGAVVGFDATLLPALKARLPNPVFTRNMLEQTLATGLEALPITGVQGITGTFRSAVCATLADRIFGQLTRSLGFDASHHPLAQFSLIPSSSVTWDLLTPYKTARWVHLADEDNGTLEGYLAQNGAADLITNSILPTFPRSHHQLFPHINFSASMTSLHALGVSVQAAAKPPHRPATANASGLIDPTSGFLPLTLKLSPGEPLEYSLTTFCVCETVNGVMQFFGQEQQRNDSLVMLRPSDFGIEIFEFEATPHLLALAELQLECTYMHSGQEFTQTLHVSDNGAILITPLEITEGRLTLISKDFNTANILTVEGLDLHSRQLSAQLFSGYGTQFATIRLNATGDDIIGLSVQPGMDGDDQLQTLSFSRTTSERIYRYSAKSPFISGFQYKLLTDNNWNFHPDPNEPLVIDF